MSCVFSPDRRYRYTLQRDWMFGSGLVNFLLLNPSSATEEKNDPTIERCERRARRWGYKGLVITNLFAYRATDPNEMKRQADPIGEDNDDHILAEACFADKVICGWGNHGAFRNRYKSVVEMLVSADIKLYAFTITNQCQPKHPLYIDYDIEPALWRTNGILETDD